MLSDEVIDKVVERLARRIEQGNEYVLEQIGKSVNKLGTLTPSRAQQLVQIMRHGGDYNKIVKKLAEITKLNTRDIKEIFKEVAKTDYQFAEQFYKYRNKKYIPWEKNTTLRKQVDAIAEMTAKKYKNLSNTLAFTTHGKDGRVVYNSIARTYQNTLDKAILNVGQGKEAFDSAMRQTLRELADSGIRTVLFESGRSMRLDSAVRMQMKSALRDLHNELQQQFGKEFGADGVEISVHSNPAPDHEAVQGRQFSTKKKNKKELSEWDKLQAGKDAVDYRGTTYNLDHDHKNGYRPISAMNCYHYTFSVILGVSDPEYSDEELKKIREDNDKGFEFEGQHYTMYEGTQLQRKLELEIRKAKDQQIIGRAQNDRDIISESQGRITLLTNKYNKLSKASGLPIFSKRMQVSGFRRVKIPQNQRLEGTEN